jgi:chloramphenicol-sensitive protein RarD
MHQTAQEQRQGRALLIGAMAFISWGLVPLYWKLLVEVPALEILVHRLIWSVVFTAAILTAQRRWAEIAEVLRSPRQIGLALLSGGLIMLNWFIFIWAVNAGRILETSLGYFIMPLVNVLLGATIFHERLRRLQWAAIGLAALGVLNLARGYGDFPWVALGLCASFVMYGLVRKTTRADSLPGLFVESIPYVPLALLYLWLRHLDGAGHFSFAAPKTAALLMGGGIVSALPLIWFAHAARHLRLSTIGVLQYLGPTLTFFIGALIYHEPFSRQHLVTFICIWAALAMYTAESRWHARRKPA